MSHSTHYYSKYCHLKYFGFVTSALLQWWWKRNHSCNTASSVCRLSNALFFHLIHFLEVTLGSCPGLSGLVNGTPARLIAFHSLIPDLQLHSSQSNLSMQMGRGELVILELECRVRMEQLGAHGNNTLVFGKINTLIKIIQQQWNLEYSQSHNVFSENVTLAEQKSYF